MGSETTLELSPFSVRSTRCSKHPPHIESFRNLHVLPTQLFESWAEQLWGEGKAVPAFEAEGDLAALPVTTREDMADIRLEQCAELDGWSCFVFFSGFLHRTMMVPTIFSLSTSCPTAPTTS